MANPMDVLSLLSNPQALADRLPPAPVVAAALTRLLRDAIVAEVVRSPVPAQFLEDLRASGKYADDAEITALYYYTWKVATDA